ncbi:ANTAR domain-containing protein [Streptomyces sp. NPDC046909]|uniref:ANTAR domain-containing protein n=1 Tax=Streptomyces sp. NPDC046909 TaxID=3155617 RepID=UPI00340C64D9
MPEAAHSGCGHADDCERLAGGTGAARLTVCARPEGDRMLVTLDGDLDLSTDQVLQQALRSALVRAREGIDLDLGGVEFCDCSGLNALLGIRQQAREQSKTVTIRGISPSAERVFTLTATLPLFLPDDDSSDGTDGDEGDEDGGGSVATQDARVEVVQLRRAMQTRGLIDLARGILMAVFTLSAEEAWSVLVMTSQNTNTKLHRTAQQLVDSIRGEALPGPAREQLSAAVTHVTAVRGRTGDVG